MILLTVSEIISLHSKLVSVTGGTDGIRNIGLLESAVYSAAASYEDNERYPTVEEKAARLLFALINDHAFIDGNKRIGILVMLMTLKLNRIEIMYKQSELIELGLLTASGELKYDDILKWIKAHL